MPCGQGAADEPVRHNYKMPAGRCGRGLNERPGAIDARVENLPGLASRGGVVRREHVDAELSVRHAAKIAEVALLKQGVVADGSPRRALKALGRRRGTGEITRQDGRDTLRLETAGQTLRLGDAAGREGVVGTLHGARGVAERLAVTDEEDRHPGA